MNVEKKTAPEKMFLMFNHTLSRIQETDARNVWGAQLQFFDYTAHSSHGLI